MRYLGSCSVSLWRCCRLRTLRLGPAILVPTEAMRLAEVVGLAEFEPVAVKPA